MKKYILLLFLLFSCMIPYSVNAITYEETTQPDMPYNINNFYLKDNNIIINGWAVTGRHQHLTGNDTHEYSIELTDKSNGEKKVYVGLLKAVDKTQLIKTQGHNTPCSSYYSSEGCYYSYTMVGFEFIIPISDLKSDSEYAIKLRIYEKLINKGFQISIYALGVDDTYEQNGVRYQLYSDINKTAVRTTTSVLRVRSGPGQNYSQRMANYSCSWDGAMLYWIYGTLNNIKGATQTKPGAIDSELWINIGYDYAGCDGGRARAGNGTTYNGWAPWIYLEGQGEPAVIKTTSIQTVTIDELRTYTSPKNTEAKALITLTSANEEDIIIKAYHDDKLVFEEENTISGTKTFNINYIIEDSGTLKVEIVSKYTSNFVSSKIYVSSEQVYNIDSSNNAGIIEVDTPVLVVTNKYGQATEYKEKIQLSAIPYEVNLSQGRGIEGVTSAISYWYPLEEFSLNQDYLVYALYPTQEDTLNYEVVDGKVKVELEKDKISRGENVDTSFFYHPDVLLALINGNLHNSEKDGLNFYAGGNIWYPSWNDELGTYNYQYVGTNLGVNKITITRDLEYSVTSTMFGNETGKFIIKRVENPTNLNVIFKKTFSYDELLEFIKE